jgi:hypothetical protein
MPRKRKMKAQRTTAEEVRTGLMTKPSPMSPAEMNERPTTVGADVMRGT